MKSELEINFFFLFPPQFSKESLLQLTDSLGFLVDQETTNSLHSFVSFSSLFLSFPF